MQYKRGPKLPKVDEYKIANVPVDEGEAQVSYLVFLGAEVLR